MAGQIEDRLVHRLGDLLGRMVCGADDVVGRERSQRLVTDTYDVVARGESTVSSRLRRTLLRCQEAALADALAP
jgi:hypothetical protein